MGVAFGAIVLPTDKGGMFLLAAATVVLAAGTLFVEQARPPRSFFGENRGLLSCPGPGLS